LSSQNSSLSLVSSQHTGRPALGPDKLAAHHAKADARDVDTVKRWVELWPQRDGAAKGRFTKAVVRKILKSLDERVHPNASLHDHLNKLSDMYNKRNAAASASASASVSEP
jgi:hypothetical protein